MGPNGVVILKGGHRLQHGERVWELAQRLGDAVEDRIRSTGNRPGQAVYTAPEGSVLHAPPAHGAGAVYDPGALLSAVVAVLAAEGLATNAGPALPACAHLLAWQGIRLVPNTPAPTAHRLATALRPGEPRRCRAMPPALLAAVIWVVLTQDGALPTQITADDAHTLTGATAIILQALGVVPDDTGAGLQAWPVIARIIDAAPHLPPPYEPPPTTYRQGGR